MEKANINKNDKIAKIIVGVKNNADICKKTKEKKKSVIAKKQTLRCPNSTLSPATSPLRSSLSIA
jgi:hypothetical protein